MKNIRVIWKKVGLVPVLMLAFASPCFAFDIESGDQKLTYEGASLDAHMHLISQRLLDGITGGGVPAANADDIIQQLNAANIDRGVVLSLGYWALPDDSNVAPENNYISQEVARYPERLVGFCGINPSYVSALEEVERCLKLPNMVGVKLHGGEYDWNAADFLTRISAVLGKAGELDAPVIIHVNAFPLAGKAMENVIAVLGENTDTRIAIAHMGGLSDRELESYLIPQTIVPSHFDANNVYMDISGALKFYEDAPLSQREMMVWRMRKFGVDKILFGSDYLHVAPQQTPVDALATLTRYPFTQPELDTILKNDGSAWLYGIK